MYAATEPQTRRAIMDNWKTIRLELGRTAEFPTGSVSRGYLIRLPLNDSDHIDEAEFAEKAHRATVRRYWSAEPDEAGQILRSAGEWVMSRGGRSSRVFKLGTQPLRLGQSVSVIEPDGTALPFRIAGIR
jgi:hypothetical protein